MKKIEAIIRPFRVDDVKRALEEVGVSGMTVSEVRGYGRQKGRSELYSGAEYVIDLIPKIKIEIAVRDGEADNVITAIIEAARSGRMGDGKIFVTPLEDVVRIRTSERGPDAL